MMRQHKKVHEHDPMFDEPRLIQNHPHQHAFTLVGDKTVFGVHMTQYHHEEHKYQLIMEFELPKAALTALRKRRASEPPGDFFVLCNHEKDALCTVPQLASGLITEVKADIFQGLPPFTEEDEKDPCFFPWSLDRVKPICKTFKVKIKRVVLFRPFSHLEELSEMATYYLWGRGDEAHLTNIQKAHLATDPFQDRRFGPDYDHVMSLAERPKWIDDIMLEAGVVMTTPHVPLLDPQTWEPDIPTAIPWDPGDSMKLLYRGLPVGYTAVAGQTYLFGSAVCCSPDMIPPPKKEGDLPLYISATPDDLLV